MYFLAFEISKKLSCKFRFDSGSELYIQRESLILERWQNEFTGHAYMIIF